MAYTIKVLSKDVFIENQRLFVNLQVQLMDGTNIVKGPQTVTAEENRGNSDIRSSIKKQLKEQIKAWTTKLAIERALSQTLSTLETEIEAEI